jgi:hypothetical protein
MYNSNAVPRNFQIGSLQPYLKIQSKKLTFPNRVMGLFLLLLMSGMGIGLFYSDYPAVTVTIFMPMQLFFTWMVAWAALGSIEICAIDDRLIIRYRILGISRERWVSADNINRFELFLRPAYDNDLYWLSIVTNNQSLGGHRLYLNLIPVIKIELNHRRPFRLYSCGDGEPCEWLGRAMADFYRVELIPNY